MKFEEYFSIQEGFSLAVSNIKDLYAGLKDFFDGGIIVRSMVVSTSFLQCSTVLMNADPFLFVDNGLVYLFYEELKYKGKGVIRMTSSKDLKKWSAPITVLEEPFHLSFPFVFKHNDEFYMLPETGRNKVVQLYKGSSDLKQWTRDSVLLEGGEDSFVDSSIIKKDRLYYLFTTRKSNGVYIQEIYFSSSLKGPYTSHPSSPISSDKKYARNSGAIFSFNGELYRPTQCCLGGYGENVSIMKIDQLSSAEYCEHIYLDDVFDRTCKRYKDGGHTFNFVKYQNGFLVATDAKWHRRNYNSIIAFTKLINNIKHHLRLE